MSDDPALRTYRGRSLEEVLPQIRAELGPDAVIVRQRDGLVGGIGGFFQQQFVEVQARPGGQRMRIDLYDEGPAIPEPLAPDAPLMSGASFATTSSAPLPAGPEALLPPVAPAPPVAVADAPAEEAAEFSPPPISEAAPAAPAPAQPAARVPGSRPKPRLSAAELLAQASGGRAGDTRTTAEILREHSASFARQLAHAELDAEPIVQRVATEGPEVPGARYAPPVDPSRRRFAPPVSAERLAGDTVEFPQRPAPAPAPAPAPDLPPAAAASAPSAPAKRTRAGRAKGSAAARASDAAAARAAKASEAAAARAAKASEAAAARAARASDAAAARTVKASDVAAASRRAEPAGSVAAAAVTEPSASGVGPQTSQALQLAAAIAANMSAAETARAEAAERRLLPVPRAGALTGAPALGPQPEPRPAPAPPRRSLFGRRRLGVQTRPRHAVASPEAVELSGTLSARGLTPTVARELLVEATAHVLPFTSGADVPAAVRATLARRIPVAPPPRLGGRAVAFVGAGGSGKTRCSAGLVAAYALGSSFPAACLTLAPKDGGAELSGLLKPHGVKVEVVASAAEAAVRIAELRSEAVVVLDTPAVAPGDEAAVQRLAAELTQLELDEIQLTLPATLSAAAANELVERLAPLAPTGLSMTHGDSTAHIGAVVELSCATRLPLSYVNAGLELPGSFAPADPLQLAERMLA
ncbi:hypothetical protein [Conexibacter sp. CPCC 206217]|uniref:hypothetical protein n=1 Tax=Conexibacter sp. CPCC 206217 TaxID=3064574 RepID=UPI0027178C0B|nr:hypothetical protein [Conexibacter sp. CPCC 206217]MDO8211390.1 hypothetical protein [Conexibacter sp. CPCC 206217]